MTVKKRGLNDAALGMLLSDTAKASAQKVDVNDLNSLPIEKLQRGQFQPRRHIASDALQELADSIKAQGIIQPIIVRRVKMMDMYEIIAGERRWRAAQLASLDKVPVVIKDISDEVTVAMALIENIQREDLNAIEEANALSRLVEEFGLTQQEVAERVGKSRTSVTNLLRILNLNPDVKLMLEQGKLELGHAKVLLALEHETQSQIARIVSLRGLSVRETEDLVKKQLEGHVKKSKPPTDPDIVRLQNRLSETLGSKVKVMHAKTGKGKLIINYNSLDELDGILEHIN